MSHFHSTNKQAQCAGEERKRAKQAQTHKQTKNPNKLSKNSGKINSNRLSSTFTKGLTMKLLFPIKYAFVYQKNYITSNGTSTKSIKKSQLSIIFHFTSQNSEIQ